VRLATAEQTHIPLSVRIVGRIHYEIPDDVHRRAKVAAAVQGVTLKQFLIAALARAVEATEAEPGQKRRPKQ